MAANGGRREAVENEVISDDSSEDSGLDISEEERGVGGHDFHDSGDGGHHFPDSGDGGHRFPDSGGEGHQFHDGFRGHQFHDSGDGGHNFPDSGVEGHQFHDGFRGHQFHDSGDGGHNFPDSGVEGHHVRGHPLPSSLVGGYNLNGRDHHLHHLSTNPTQESVKRQQQESDWSIYEHRGARPKTRHQSEGQKYPDSQGSVYIHPLTSGYNQDQNTTNYNSTRLSPSTQLAASRQNVTNSQLPQEQIVNLASHGQATTQNSQPLVHATNLASHGQATAQNSQPLVHATNLVSRGQGPTQNSEPLVHATNLVSRGQGPTQISQPLVHATNLSPWKHGHMDTDHFPLPQEQFSNLEPQRLDSTHSSQCQGQAATMAPQLATHSSLREHANTTNNLSTQGPSTTCSPQHYKSNTTNSQQLEVPNAICSPQSQGPNTVCSPSPREPNTICSPQSQGPNAICSQLPQGPNAICSQLPQGPNTICSPQQEQCISHNCGHRQCPPCALTTNGQCSSHVTITQHVSIGITVIPPVKNDLQHQSVRKDSHKHCDMREIKSHLCHDEDFKEERHNIQGEYHQDRCEDLAHSRYSSEHTDAQNVHEELSLQGCDMEEFPRHQHGFDENQNIGFDENKNPYYVSKEMSVNQTFESESNKSENVWNGNKMAAPQSSQQKSSKVKQFVMKLLRRNRKKRKREVANDTEKTRSSSVDGKSRSINDSISNISTFSINGDWSKVMEYVFITFAHAQYQDAKFLVQFLRERNVDAHMDLTKEDFDDPEFQKMCQDRNEWVMDVYQKSAFIIVLCSPDYIKECVNGYSRSQASCSNTQWFYNQMKQDQQNGSKSRLLTVLMPNCQSQSSVPEFFRQSKCYEWPSESDTDNELVAVLTNQSTAPRRGPTLSLVQETYNELWNSPPISIPMGSPGIEMEVY